MATTPSAVLDRIRAVCLAADLVEVDAGVDFERVPVTAIDGRFAAQFDGGIPIGGMAFTEESRGTAEVAVTRLVNADFDTARRAVTGDLTVLLSAIVRDGASDGDYAVEDEDRAMRIEQPKGAAYLIGRLRVGVNFETQL